MMKANHLITDNATLHVNLLPKAGLAKGNQLGLPWLRSHV